MTTELAIHQTLNETKYNTVNTDDHEVQDISTKIDLENNMRKISVEEKYEFNYGSLIFLILTILMGLLGYTTKGVQIVYNSLCFLVCLVIIIGGILYMKAYRKKNLKKIVNQIFGYQTSTDLFDFEVGQYAGSILLVCIMCSSALTVFESTSSVLNFELRTTVITNILPMILNFTFFVFHKTVKCNQEIEEQKKSILKKYKNTENINNRIEQRLEDWKKSKKLTDKWDRKLCKTYDRRIEMVCIFVVVFLVHYCGTGIWDWDTLQVNNTMKSILITGYFLYDCVFVTLLIYSCYSVYLHYKFPAIIMDELAAPINAETTDDLIGWWQLRKFYANSIVKIYSSSLGLLVGLVTMVNIVVGLYAIDSIIGIQNLLDMQIIELSIFVMFLVSLTLLLVSNATNYHSNQLSHVHMIHRELMALRKYEGDNIFSIKNNDELELRKYENDIQHYVANQMIQDIQNNSDTIKVMGISINARFMVMLRAGLGTLFIAVIGIIFAK